MASIEVGHPRRGVSWAAVFFVGMYIGVALGAFILDALAVGVPCECRVRP